MTAISESERQDIEELLPWHAAGTLSRSEGQRVDAALAADPELARRYALVREEMGQTVQVNEALGVPTARITERLFAKIDAEPKRGGAAASVLRVGEFLASLTPHALAWAAAVATILILVQAGFIVSLVLKNSRGEYQTASAPAARHEEGAFALIRFQPQASAADIAKFLQENKLTIVGGPTAGGLYRVRVAPKALPQDELAALIKTLQDDKVVAFIGAAE